MGEIQSDLTAPRTELVPSRALLGIVSEQTDFVGSDSLSAWNHRPLPVAETFALLPPNMSAEEINALGLRLSELVEKMSPSRDGVSHGRRAESRATILIGRYAVVQRDMITATSSAEHLRDLGGVHNRISAFALSQTVKKIAKSGK